MSAWSKTVFLCLSLFVWVFPSCTYYTEKQTEAVSQTVYATKDSIDKARFDLADEYSSQATRLIKPPKHRIEISYLHTGSAKSNISSVSSKKEKSATSKTPVVIIPERLRGLTVMVVNSEEYNLLLQDKEAHDQLKTDFAALAQTKKEVDEELTTQAIHRDKMVKDLNTLKESIAKKNLVIMKLSLTSTVLGIVLVGAVVLRIKGIL